MSTVRVATWNVLADAFARPDWFPGVDPALLAPGARRDAITVALDRLDADVVLLQEAEPALLDSLTAWRVEFAQRTGKPDGCAILVRGRWSVRESRTLHYDAQVSRLAQIATLMTPDGRTLTAVNTHLEYSPLGVLGGQQATELARALPNGPLVLGGDLNDAPGGPARAALASVGVSGIDYAEPTSLFGGREFRALDVLGARGTVLDVLESPFVVERAVPTLQCPSDHVPVRGLLHLP
jgi:endonuclease/exonuclease/phosphatase family metal-dependent hydrolase